MGRYTGTAQLIGLDGASIEPVVHVDLSDNPEMAPSYARSAPFYGEFWVDSGDLMDPLRDRQRCLLHLDDGTVVQMRLNTYDRGGSRAQAIGEGPQLPTWR